MCWRGSATPSCARRRPGCDCDHETSGLERCESGRSGRFAKPLYRETGTEGSNPSLSASFCVRDEVVARMTDMAFLPFARKYRPQTFADLIGQPHVTGTLTRALQQQRITQAYLFAG